MNLFQVVMATVFIISAVDIFSAPRYTISDLGTLGGSKSYGTAINDWGQVTGYAGYCKGCYGYGIYHAFVTDSDGNMVNIDPLGTGASYSQDINNRGQATGYLSSYPHNTRAFVTDNDGKMIDLGSLGGASSKGSAINNNGQVTGYSDTSSGERHAFVTNNNGEMVDLGTLGGNKSYGSAINDLGQVAGNSYTAEDNDHRTDRDNQAFVTDSDRKMVYLTLGGNYSFAQDINNNGQVTGTARKVNNESRAFVATSDGNVVDLGTLGCGNREGEATGGMHSYGTAINSSGQVTGWSSCLGNGYMIIDHAFVTDNNGKMIDLGTLEGGSSSGVDINDKGQVIGYSRSEGKYPRIGTTLIFVTDSDRNMLNLSELIDKFSINWKKLDSVRGISNAGHITGYGTTIDGFTHAYLLTPMTPSSPRISISKDGLNVTLTWNYVNGASGYKLYYAPYPYNADRDRIHSFDLGNNQEFSAKLRKGVAYYVAISSYNSVGESGYSNIEKFTIE